MILRFHLSSQAEGILHPVAFFWGDLAHDDPRVFKLVADWLVSRGAVEKTTPAGAH